MTYSTPQLSSTIPRAGGSPKLANIMLLSSWAEELGYCTPPTYHLDAEHFALALGAAGPWAESPPPLTDEAFRACHRALLDTPLPATLEQVLRVIYTNLEAGTEHPLAVRSCCELEDSAHHGFAGTFDSVLHVVTFEDLCAAVRTVYASAFADRALGELHAAGVDRVPTMWVAIQQMVGGAGWLGGVVQTQAAELAPFPLMSLSVSADVTAVTSASDIPEDYLIARPHLDTHLDVVAHRQPGTSTADAFSLSEPELRALAKVFVRVEEAFGEPLEIEWLLSPAGELYLVQARPVQVQYASAVAVAAADSLERLACAGLPVGNGRVVGPIFFAKTPEQALKAPPGGILAVPGRTDADWAGAVRHAVALVTATGSRGSHFARIARDTHRLAVVGCGDALFSLQPGEQVTVFCAEGVHGAVYRGDVPAGKLQCSTDDLLLRSAADAFSQARISQPHKVNLDLAPGLAALRLPLDSQDPLPPRVARLMAGHTTLDGFVERRLLQELVLVGIAFRQARITVLRSLPERWLPNLERAVELAGSRYGVTATLAAANA